MLASPIATSSPFVTADPTQSSQYQPSKTVAAFKTILPPEIDFVQGSSTGALAVPEGKYEPVNAITKATTTTVTTLTTVQSTKTPLHSAPSSPTKSSPTNLLKIKSLHIDPIEESWPAQCTMGCGLLNIGNTCFLNSALQCLLHTGPLLRLVLAHGKEDPCKYSSDSGACSGLQLQSGRSAGFCMTCNFRQTVTSVHGSGKSNRAIVPSHITGKLHSIAKHMRKGRQEDSHEFLRYAIDGFQKSCLAGFPQKKMDPKLAETTWVHQLFAGRLRSRVTCERCAYNSDTFDRILDLSLDITRASTLKDALKSFVAVDHLKGADKYKCEKCKVPVPARKQFTVHEAPLVLTIHLKRFSPLGRKIAHVVEYDEHLSLRPIMSEGVFGPRYTLYGVICHAGSGPNSGHYYAHVKSREGRWYHMNDELVSPDGKTPLNLKSAYILFYMRDKGQKLDAAIHDSSLMSQQRTNKVAGMKKRKSPDDSDEGSTQEVKKRFIGPLLPSAMAKDEGTPRLSTADPQALKLKQKLTALRPSASLVDDYASDSSEENQEKDDDTNLLSPLLKKSAEPAPPIPPPKNDDTTIPVAALECLSSPPIPPPSSSPAFPTISPASFYGPAKRKNQDDHDGSPSTPQSPQSPHRSHHRHPKHIVFSPTNKSTPLKHRKRHEHSSPRKSLGITNPYSARLSNGGNTKTYSKKARMRARVK